MPRKFAYRAKDNNGQLMTGTILAENETAVAAYILDKGYYVTSIKKQCNPNLLWNIVSDWQRVSIKDLAIFCRQFATMTDAGLPLLTCLTVLIEQTSHSKLKMTLQDIYQKVKEGNTLSKSMARYSEIFPEIMISMMAAGEIGGVLDIILNRLAAHFEKEYKMNEKVKSAMAYPAVVVGMAGVSLLFILTFVLPRFMQLVANMKVELPLPTRMLLSVSELLQQYGLWLLVFSTVGSYGLKLLVRQAQGRLMIDQVILRLPVFGLLCRKIAIARFSRSLGTLLCSGVPIITALETVKKTTGNIAMVQALTTVQHSIRGGMGLAAPLGVSKLFTPMVVQMLAVGEETGKIDAMLEKIADFYESDVDDMVNRLSSLLEPVLIGILGVIIGVIVIAVMLPLFDVLTQVGQ
ncbi:MAG TPA: type II secretion system F family protein [Negativicutes bacterium]